MAGSTFRARSPSSLHRFKFQTARLRCASARQANAPPPVFFATPGTPSSLFSPRIKRGDGAPRSAPVLPFAAFRCGNAGASRRSIAASSRPEPRFVARAYEMPRHQRAPRGGSLCPRAVPRAARARGIRCPPPASAAPGSVVETSREDALSRSRRNQDNRVGASGDKFSLEISRPVSLTLQGASRCSTTVPHLAYNHFFHLKNSSGSTAASTINSSAHG
jgi:hypothetical protein